jgi:hypothetical protein
LVDGVEITSKPHFLKLKIIKIDMIIYMAHTLDFVNVQVDENTTDIRQEDGYVVLTDKIKTK